MNGYPHTMLRVLSLFFVIAMFCATSLSVMALAAGQRIDAHEVAISRVKANWETELLLFDLNRVIYVRWYIPGQSMDAHWSPDGKRLALIQFAPPPPWPGDAVVIWEAGRLSRPKSLQLPDFRWEPPISNLADLSVKNMALTLSVRGNTDIYLADAEGQNWERLTDSSVDEYAPRWSPDGRYLAYTALQGEFFGPRVRLVEMMTREDRVLSLTGSFFRIDDLTWSPDGAAVAYSALYDDGQRIYVQDLSTREETVLLPDTLGDQQNPRWSPDGESLLLNINNQLHLVNSDGTDLRPIELVDAVPQYGVWADARTLIVAGFDQQSQTDSKLTLFALSEGGRFDEVRPILRDKFYYPPLARP